MWPWIKRWRDWAMHELWPLHRIGPQPQALHYSYEKAGLTLHDQPIPWNAEAVLVEALVCLRSTAPRRRAEFELRLPHQDPLAPETLRRGEGPDLHRLVFRVPPLERSTTAQLIWKGRQLGQLTLPMLPREDFLQQLRLVAPTLFVRLGDQSVSCQTFVATQCRGLIASAVLCSPTALAPLLDLDLRLELRSERGGQLQVMPARLASSQLAGRQALITIVPKRFPRRIGAWTATWMVGDYPLASHQVRAISQRTFHRSLRISDTRFVSHSEKDGVKLTRHAPQLGEKTRLGPCFLISSREPGMAGLCPLQVRAQVPDGPQAPVLMEQVVLITDGPTLFAPGTIDAVDLSQITAFELRLKGALLGALGLRPAPAAAFTPEGGFKSTQEFTWVQAADEELTERLGKLFEGPGSSP